MICKHCGAEIPEGSRFCIYCGKKLEDSLFVADDQTQIRQPVPTPSSHWADESPEAQEAPYTEITDADDELITLRKHMKIGAILMGIYVFLTAGFIVYQMMCNKSLASEVTLLRQQNIQQAADIATLKEDIKNLKDDLSDAQTQAQNAQDEAAETRQNLKKAQQAAQNANDVLDYILSW